MMKFQTVRKAARFQSMKHLKFRARFFLVASIVTAALIFWFSAQKGNESQALSDPLTLQVAQLLRPDLMQMSEHERINFLNLLSTVIRKNAHFCEFALLGFNLICWLRLRDGAMPPNACRTQAWVMATLYAVTDELHQLFINERSAQVLDVLIDSAGSLAGTLVMTLCLAILPGLQQKRASRH